MKIEPVLKFEDHDVWSDGKFICFGCGDVRISKVRINRAARYMEDKQFAKGAAKFGPYLQETSILDMVIREDYNKFLNFLIKYKRQIEFFSSLMWDTNRNANIADLLNIEPHTYRGFAIVNRAKPEKKRGWESTRYYDDFRDFDDY